jgi:hypothetical protein
MNMLLTLLFHLISSQTKLISLVGFAIKYENGKQSWNESNFDLQLIGRHVELTIINYLNNISPRVILT